MPAWEFQIAGKAVRIGDIEIDEIDTAIAGTGVDWAAFYGNPFKSGKALKAFLKYMASQMDVDLPPLTADNVAEMVKTVDDDLPSTYTDGMPDPDPKADGTPTA
jgi:hypothetical protein